MYNIVFINSFCAFPSVALSTGDWLHKACCYSLFCPCPTPSVGRRGGGFFGGPAGEVKAFCSIVSISKGIHSSPLIAACNEAKCFFHYSLKLCA